MSVFRYVSGNQRTGKIKAKKDTGALLMFDCSSPSPIKQSLSYNLTQLLIANNIINIIMMVIIILTHLLM